MDSIISFNSAGFGLKQRHYVDSLLKDRAASAFFIQEHHLLFDNLGLLDTISNDYTSFSSSAYKSNASRGRPSAGCAILMKNSLVSSVTKQFTDNPRFTAVNIKNRTLLLISVYFPCDNNANNLYCFSNNLY